MAVRDHTRAAGLSAILCCALAALDTACGSESRATNQDDGGMGVDSPGIALSQRANALAVENHSMQCAFCTCHPFVPGSTKCEAALLDSYPPAKRMVVCEIAAAEQMEACLSLAQNCADAQRCEATEQSQTAKCPTVDPLQLPLPPSGC
jgi:hypothetical protein